MLSRIEDTLRKINVQEEFLHQNGCQRLADWMKPMPDKTYPNQKIVSCILGCVDRLSITKEYLSESDLERVLELYKDGIAGNGYNQC